MPKIEGDIAGPRSVGKGRSAPPLPRAHKPTTISGLRKGASTDQRSQLALHLDFEASHGSPRVNDDAVDECPEIVDQRSAVVLCAGMAGHRFSQRVDGLY